MKTAVIYARYSCENQTEQSIEGQLRVCQEYAQKQGILIVDTYIDRAQTGTNDNRAAFQQMLSDSAQKQFQYVIVYKLDRFARNKLESVVNKQKLRDNGVLLLSAMEQITDTPEGHMMETILEGFNQYFSEELAQKVRRGMRETRLKGLYQGGGLPYGYKAVDRRVVVNEIEAEVVKYIYKEYACGITVREITDALAERKMLYKGRAFPRSEIYHILRNEKYTGAYKCRDEIVDNMYPPIVSLETWQKVHEILERNKYGKHSVETIYLLKFKAKCGYCGNPMYSETGTGYGGVVKRYYKCAGKKKDHNGCSKGQVRKEYLEEIVINAIVEELNSPQALNYMTKRLLDIQDEQMCNNSAISVLTKEKAKIDRALDNIADAIQDGMASKTTAKRLQELEKRQEELEEQIAIEQSKQAVPLDKNQIKMFYADALKMEPRMLMEYLIKEVIVYDDKIEIIFKSPIKIIPDESRRFLLCAKLCNANSSALRSNKKRGMQVEIWIR